MFGREFSALAAACSFLTRVPVPGRHDADDLARAGAYFPLVGASVGAGMGVLSRQLGGPAGVAAGALLTGALHLDALADSADALGVRDRERALEIMRDSRIGSFGAVVLCLDLMLKADALADCADPLAAALAAGTLSRAVPVVLSAALPYARSGSGMGRALGPVSAGRVAVAVGSAAAVARAAGADRVVFGVAGALTLASAWFWRRRIGGVTGDTLGASIEMVETAVLLTWSRRR